MRLRERFLNHLHLPCKVSRAGSFSFRSPGAAYHSSSIRPLLPPCHCCAEAPYHRPTTSSCAVNFLRTLLCAAVLATTIAPAWAAVSRDAAAAIAQRATGGRVLAVEQAQAGGRAMWRVKVLTPNGEVRVIMVDVASGQAQ